MGQTKTFHVFEQGKHEYTIIDKETTKGRKISLFYSDSETWTGHTRGTLAMTLKDNGNGVRLNKNTKSLDYGQLTQMRLLFNYLRETESHEHDREKSQVYETTQDIVKNNVMVL